MDNYYPFWRSWPKCSPQAAAHPPVEYLAQRPPIQWDCGRRVSGRSTAQVVTATSRSRRSRIPDFCSKIKTPKRSSEETSNRFEVGLEPVHALPAYFRTAARLLTGGRRELRSQFRMITTRSVPPALPHASRLCGLFLGDQNKARGSDAWRLTIHTAAATKIPPSRLVIRFFGEGMHRRTTNAEGSVRAVL